MNMNISIRRTLDQGAVALAALLVLSSCGGGAKKQPTVMSAVMPDADVAVYINGQEINNSPIGKEFEKFSDEMKKELGKDKNAPDPDQLLEELGLKNEDFLSAIASFRVVSLGDGKDGVPKVDVCIAANVAKPLSLSKLQSALGNVFPEIKDKVKMDGEFLNYTMPDTDFSLYQAATGGNKLHFFGSEKKIANAAMARLDAKLPAGLEAAKAGLPPGSNFWMVFKVGQTIQDKLKEALEKAKAGAKTNPMGAQQKVAFLQALQSLKNGSVGLKFADDLTVAIALNFGSPDDAQQANVLLNQGINMGKGLLAMGGINAPFVNTLKAEAKDATITVSMKFTTDDIKAFKKAQQQQKAGPPAGSPSGQ